MGSESWLRALQCPPRWWDPQGQAGLALVRTKGNSCGFATNTRTGETALGPGERNMTNGTSPNRDTLVLAARLAPLCRKVLISSPPPQPPTINQCESCSLFNGGSTPGMNVWFPGSFCRKQVEEPSPTSSRFQDEKMNIGRKVGCLELPSYSGSLPFY